MRKTSPLTSIIIGVCVTIASFVVYLVGMTAVSLVFDNRWIMTTAKRLADVPGDR